MAFRIAHYESYVDSFQNTENSVKKSNASKKNGSTIFLQNLNVHFSVLFDVICVYFIKFQSI